MAQIKEVILSHQLFVSVYEHCSTLTMPESSFQSSKVEKSISCHIHVPSSCLPKIAHIVKVKCPLPLIPKIKENNNIPNFSFARPLIPTSPMYPRLRQMHLIEKETPRSWKETAKLQYLKIYQKIKHWNVLEPQVTES